MNKKAFGIPLLTRQAKIILKYKYKPNKKSYSKHEKALSEEDRKLAMLELAGISLLSGDNDLNYKGNIMAKIIIEKDTWDNLRFWVPTMLSIIALIVSALK